MLRVGVILLGCVSIASAWANDFPEPDLMGIAYIDPKKDNMHPPGEEHAHPNDDLFHQMSVYALKPRGSKNPAIVLIPGGGFVGLDDGDAMNSRAHRFTSRGFTVFSIQYRVATPDQAQTSKKQGSYPFPASIQDARAALRFIRANAERFGIDPTRIGVAGFSAGGGLAADLAVSPNSDERADAALEVSGPTDFVEQQAFSNKNTKGVLPYWMLWLECSTLKSAQDLNSLSVHSAQAQSYCAKIAKNELNSVCPDICRNQFIASPALQVSENSAPLMIIHGKVDKEVPYFHAERLRAAYLKNARNVEVVLLELPESGHAVEELQKHPRWWNEKIIPFFKRHLEAK